MNLSRRIISSLVFFLCAYTTYAQKTRYNLFHDFDMFNHYINAMYETFSEPESFESVYGFSIKDLAEAAGYFASGVFEDTGEITLDIERDNESVLMPSLVVKIDNKTGRLTVTGGALLLNFFVSALEAHRKYSLEKGIAADNNWAIPVLAKIINNNWTIDARDNEAYRLLSILNDFADLIIAEDQLREQGKAGQGQNIANHEGADLSLILFSVCHELAHLTKNRDGKTSSAAGGKDEEIRCDIIATTLFIMTEKQNPGLAMDINAVLFFFKVLGAKEHDAQRKRELQERYDFIKTAYPLLRDFDREDQS